MIELWINIETVNAFSNFSKIHGPYKSEREALEDRKNLAAASGKPIYDFDQRKLAIQRTSDMPDDATITKRRIVYNNQSDEPVITLVTPDFNHCFSIINLPSSSITKGPMK